MCLPSSMRKETLVFGQFRRWPPTWVDLFRTRFQPVLGTVYGDSIRDGSKVVQVGIRLKLYGFRPIATSAPKGTHLQTLAV